MLTKEGKGTVRLAEVGGAGGQGPLACFHFACSVRVCLRCRCLRKPFAIFSIAFSLCWWSLFQRERIVGCVRFRC